MNIRTIKVVYLKELLDTIRDRRTLIAMIVVPILLFPVMMIGFGWFAGTQTIKMAEETAKLAVLGKDNAPHLYQLIEQSNHLQIVQYPNPREALSKGEIQAILEIPEQFESKVESEAPAEITLLFDAATIKSNIAKGKVYAAIEGYRKELVTRRLESRKINESILKPFEINEQNVASEEKMTGMVLGMILPYIVILLSLTGAMYPAIDLTAGEKERGTMETLLISPATRLELVIGKFLTVFTASFITGILATISMFVTLMLGLSILKELTKELAFSIQFGAVFVMLLLLVPVSMIFSALLMSIAIFARSYKEAQSYISPLMILVVMPVVIPMMAPTMELNLRWVWVPIVNVSLILKEVFTGTYNWGYIGLIFLSMGCYAAIALFIATRLFQREKVLFRT
jgi:sodium transport system permease protein